MSSPYPQGYLHLHHHASTLQRNSGPGGKGLVQGLPASFMLTKCRISGPEGALQSGEWTPLLLQGAQAKSSRHIHEASRQWTQEFEKVPRGRKNQKKKGRK